MLKKLMSIFDKTEYDNLYVNDIISYGDCGCFCDSKLKLGDCDER